MIGAITGDIIGSVYEFDGIKSKDFPLFSESSQFTDDTVLIIAVTDVLLGSGDYANTFREYYARYPDCGYGGRFHQWARSKDLRPYNSFGNGSAMRVSPVGWFFDDLESVLSEAKRSARVTHNHPEGIKGAQAVAASVFMARHGESKDTIRDYVARGFDYDLDRTVDEIRPSHHFDETCQGTVPAAMIAFLDSTDFEDCIRNAISLGGDADTLACIAGSIAEAFYGGVPDSIREQAICRLDPDLRAVADAFIPATRRRPPREPAGSKPRPSRDPRETSHHRWKRAGSNASKGVVGRPGAALQRDCNGQDAGLSALVPVVETSMRRDSAMRHPAVRELVVLPAL